MPKAAKPAAKKVKAAKPAGEKKAPNAYMKFSNANRDAVKAKNPTAKITDLSKIIGAMWQKLSVAEKEAWKTK